MGSWSPTRLAPILKSEPNSSASMDAEEHSTVQDCILSAMDHVGTRSVNSNQNDWDASWNVAKRSCPYADLKSALGFFLCRTLAHHLRLFDDGPSMPFHASVESKLVEIEALEDGVIDTFAEGRKCDFERMVFSDNS